LYEIRKSNIKGEGVFATRNIKKDKHIFNVNLSLLPSHTLEEIDKNPKLKADGDHSDYVGHGKYVIDFSPASYMNHSCAPSCYVKMKTIASKDVYALRDIDRGEELIHDYTLTSVDQFAGMVFWAEKCKCGSKNCRGILTGDFFTLPNDIQLKFYRNLPPSIIRRYHHRFKKLTKNL